ncbi:anti-sigma regulatory factor [Chlamydia trachomatis]|uniref:Sigma regulatory factor-histidine kinase n=4 Tax=Chlamydia trachomatis TaxID=813 RepID=O84553_CHLTR|nr:ATP-binding protein [Chlamydia trachomatis]NP_220064.1 serine/threonine protein kinase RsbW [Chlamydia trachomatis D/UW-3/CX]AAC68151.1 sigma regulatory factor-histidine kinase [Chlamydia trachomatis D/UW-3/CX]ADH18256.1 sigma regulatory factor-histidine kinase [Chlamydia trachomatis G/9768]ADH19180.1 sigma regulatory factor-histidine kinase [Chlamydia trachomatis G/11222]ADH20104.1 sigma regulatory factor-histidine kinase [Chlamydia trachomatis G/11074]ADH97201.1 sigma regulatory factor-h
MTFSEGEQVFPATLQDLYPMLDFVKRAGVHCNCTQKKLSKLELACEELLLNIITHAYKGLPSTGWIRILCTETPDALLVRITDHGPAFNPITASPDIMRLDLPIEQRRIGGLGIFLAKYSVDVFDYERVNDTNVVTLTLYTKPHNS